MQPETKWTVGELLDWTAKYFAQKKFDSPRLDAEILLAHALKKKRIELYVSHDQVSDRAAFRSLLYQFPKGIAQLLLGNLIMGNVQFYSFFFKLVRE